MSSKRAKKRKLKRHMCDGKKQHETKERATQAVYNFHIDHGGKWMHPYKCQFCHFWHIEHVQNIDYNRRKR